MSFSTKDLALLTRPPASARKARKAGTPTPAECRTPVRLTLPYPPSANRYWRKTKHGRVYVSEEAKAFKADVAKIGAGCRPLTGDVSLLMVVFRPRKSGDLSNRIKVLEDALIGIAFADDKQVTHICALRRDDKDKPGVEVVVRPAKPGMRYPDSFWDRDPEARP